jgi:hypothetical protein
MAAREMPDSLNEELQELLRSVLTHSGLPADSGDLERLIRSIMNTGSGDHEHPLALA